MEHLLLCVARLTGIALVSLDLSSMQFPIAGFRKSRLVWGLLCRLGVCFQVITEICDRLSSIGSVVWRSSCFRLVINAYNTSQTSYSVHCGCCLWQCNWVASKLLFFQSQQSDWITFYILYAASCNLCSCF